MGVYVAKKALRAAVPRDGRVSYSSACRNRLHRCVKQKNDSQYIPPIVRFCSYVQHNPEFCFE